MQATITGKKKKPNKSNQFSIALHSTTSMIQEWLRGEELRWIIFYSSKKGKGNDLAGGAAEAAAMQR